MNSLDLNFTIILPELIVIAASLVVMMADAFDKRGERTQLTAGLALAGLVAAGVATVWLWADGVSGQQAFQGMVVQDELRMAFTLIFLLVSALTVLISMVWVDQEHLPGGEFYSLLLFATSGMMLMAVGSDLVIIFLGLEILSIATYVMAGFRRADRKSNESSLKYFILGSFSSAFLLYGIALIYGGTATRGGQVGTTNVYQIALQINDSLYPGLLFAGAAMMLIGFAFKIATAPFHIWTPDVYEGAPTPVTAFMAAGPKAAGFASFLRVFLFAFPVALGATSVAGQLHEAWTSALGVLAVLTMTIGNLVAIVQSNVKRMLAYSSIAHAGYALVGFIAAGTTVDPALAAEAQAGVVFYLLTYAVMNLGAFTVVTLISRSGDRRTEVEDYNGIGFAVPFLAFTLTLFLLSLLGMPLTAGFIGKVAVFGPAIKTNSGPLVALVVIGVINTAISAYYYLRLIIVMFFRERSTTWAAPPVPASAVAALVITALGVLYLGIFPNRVLDALRGRQATRSVTQAERSFSTVPPR